MSAQKAHRRSSRNEQRSNGSNTPSTRSSSGARIPSNSTRADKNRHRILLCLTILTVSLFCFHSLPLKDGIVSSANRNRLDSPPANRSSISHNLRSTLSSDSSSQCRIYLAESSIANGGLGIFTTEFIPKGGQTGNLGLCIPVDIPPHDGASQLWSHTHGNNAWFWSTEYEARQLCPGISTIVNTQMQKSNVALTALTRPSNAGLSRLESPGAGAISHQYGQYHVALKDIPAGTEITYDYGDWTLPGEESKVEKQIMPHRPLSFLREHGMCMDNIDVKPSLIPHAGRGAFSSRAISKGGLIAPAPLVAIQGKSSLASNELLRNYMFETDSSMAFVPYGEGVNFINHSNQPNVGLRWSSNKFHHADLLTVSKSRFWRESWPGALIIEFYALRFIRPGEELLIDYGSDWDQAWTDHVKAWKPTPQDDFVYPSNLDETMELRTVVEQQSQPNPSNLATVCRTPVLKKRPFEIQWHEPAVHPEETYWYCWCHILGKNFDKKEGEFLYTVSLQCDELSDYKEYDPSTFISEEQQILTQVPRHAIRWEEKPFQSDQFLENSFRHPMSFPDDLVPEQWKAAH